MRPAHAVSPGPAGPGILPPGQPAYPIHGPTVPQLFSGVYHWLVAGIPYAITVSNWLFLVSLGLGLGLLLVPRPMRNPYYRWSGWLTVCFGLGAWGLAHYAPALLALLTPGGPHV